MWPIFVLKGDVNLPTSHQHIMLWILWQTVAAFDVEVFIFWLYANNLLVCVLLGNILSNFLAS